MFNLELLVICQNITNFLKHHTLRKLPSNFTVRTKKYIKESKRNSRNKIDINVTNTKKLLRLMSKWDNKRKGRQIIVWSCFLLDRERERVRKRRELIALRPDESMPLWNISVMDTQTCNNNSTRKNNKETKTTTTKQEPEKLWGANVVFFCFFL